MKTDTYTKSVLTIIAVCLSIIVLKDIDIIPKAYAEGSTTTLSNYGLVPVNEDGTITVKLDTSNEIDVNIKSISTYDKLKVDLNQISTSEELNVNIDEIGGSYVSSGGPIKVKIQN
ncbi:MULTISPECIES: hypothetical protein [Aquimarina]|uniref:Auto-transporter adhesin head GIN domain-containing protein n=1 Tax=Aquimarina rubra TaxID=1920033 RepID=A0ABW5LLB7_9FLAO